MCKRASFFPSWHVRLLVSGFYFFSFHLLLSQRLQDSEDWGSLAEAGSVHTLFTLGGPTICWIALLPNLGPQSHLEASSETPVQL